MSIRIGKGVDVPTTGIVYAKDPLASANEGKCHCACLLIVEGIHKTATCDGNAQVDSSRRETADRRDIAD